jgi:hypothetical protein
MIIKKKPWRKKNHFQKKMEEFTKGSDMVFKKCTSKETGDEC